MEYVLFLASLIKPYARFFRTQLSEVVLPIQMVHLIQLFYTTWLLVSDVEATGCRITFFG